MTTVTHPHPQIGPPPSRQDLGDSTLVELALDQAPNWPRVQGAEVPWTERGDAAAALAEAIRRCARSLNLAERSALARELIKAGW